jgi:hypothetical protein
MVYGIGAQKAGTTWLYETLRQSPDCHFSPFKEVHYFNVVAADKPDLVQTGRIETLRHFTAKLTDEASLENRRALAAILKLARVLKTYTDPPGSHAGYVDLMRQGYRGQKLICDITPAYATLQQDSFAEMARIAPAKFVFILRDPVDRMWSQVRMAVTAMLGADVDRASYDAACLRRVRELSETGQLPNVARANYRRTLQALEAAVPAERIHCLFYEDLFTQQSLDRLCGFLEIAPLTATPDKRSNPGRPSPLPADAETRLYDGLRAQYEFAAARFGRDGLPLAWRDRMDRLAAR